MQANIKETLNTFNVAGGEGYVTRTCWRNISSKSSIPSYGVLHELKDVDTHMKCLDAIHLILLGVNKESPN